MTMTEITRFLDKKFAKNTRVPIAKLIDPIKHGATMTAGTLVLMASGDRKLRLKILEKDTPHKGFSEPLLLNSYAREQRLTPNFLLWYLSHPEVREYLLAHTTGSVLLRVPRNILHALPVPLPTHVFKEERIHEVIVAKTNDALSRLINAFYSDYQLNLNNGRFRTATILAGAISEVILYQLLLEQEIDRKILSEDRNLGLSKMLDYVQLLKLERTIHWNWGQSTN
ncbi:MAG: hypothetical protein HY203_07620 [Nitrospirae bacterium]|nr:hypothetical protein [Nitrospirota bacterium]